MRSAHTHKYTLTHSFAALFLRFPRVGRERERETADNPTSTASFQLKPIGEGERENVRWGEGGERKKERGRNSGTHLPSADQEESRMATPFQTAQADRQIDML